MDSISFKSTSKENQEEEKAFRRKTRKNFIVITLSATLLISLAVCVSVAVLLPTRMSGRTRPDTKPEAYSADLISNICNVTLYPEPCVSSITSLAKSSNRTAGLDPLEVFKMSLEVARNELVNLSPLPKTLLANSSENDRKTIQALLDCGTLFCNAINRVVECISSMNKLYDVDDIRTWLSTAITNQKTCTYGVTDTRNGSRLVEVVTLALHNSTIFTSNSLAIATHILPVLGDLQTLIGRKLIGIGESEKLSDKKRLLEGNLKPNITVAKDGSGDFATICDALDSIPKKSEARTIIYIKAGVYVENVTVDQWNVMIYGDGMFETIVSGNKSSTGGVLTFSSATFAAEGKGFIAKDIGFKNTAGPKGFQAVAVRSSADQSVFYRCYFDAYQDTLYAISGRQFYCECVITGTIDFIFGNAAAVFQNCSILPRQPISKQFDAITAQGKTDPNQNTGFVLHHCQIKPFDDLTAQTFLGRPWENYSTTVLMESFIDRLVNPMGWAQWNPMMDPPSTIFYAEYRNDGPGAALDERVKWVGFRPNITDKQAEKFSVDSFIQGSKWIPKKMLLYDATL